MNFLFKQIKLPKIYKKRSIRQQLIDWYIPRKMQHLLRYKRQILINGKYKPISSILYGGEKITLNFNGLDFNIPQYKIPVTSNLDILYENENILIINKPYGQKSHPNNIYEEKNTALNIAQKYLISKNKFAFITHRLDKDTSGIMIIAKDPITRSIINNQLKKGIIQKTYTAIVKGNIINNGIIYLPIECTIDNKIKKRQVNYYNGKKSITNYRVIYHNQKYSVLSVKIQTGRTHQIRVHFSSIGHPILGDKIYSNDFMKYQRMHLHSTKISLNLPFSEKTLIVNCNPKFNIFKLNNGH